MYYLKSRYYDPEIGRFITIDDLSYIDPDTINGLNLYAYCGNNPVMNVDPDGTSWWSRFWKGLIIAVATVALVALTIVTCGAGSIVGGLIIGATIGAAGELFSQTVIGGKAFSEVNWLQVGFGALGGALTAIPGVGYIGAAFISGGVGFATSFVNGASLRESILSGLGAFATSLIAGAFIRGIGLAVMGKVNAGNYSGKKIFLNNTGEKVLSGFNPQINKQQNIFSFVVSRMGIKGLSKIAYMAAGYSSYLIEFISSLI